MYTSYSVATSNMKPSWEYQEITLHRHLGWVPMAQHMSDLLEDSYCKDPCAIVRIPNEDDAEIVWKLDLGKMTQRRLREGLDNCTRRIRRIFVEKDGDPPCPSVASVD